MRNLHHVILEIKGKLPKEYSIDDLLSSVEYSSPEMIGHWWNETQEFLMEIMPSNPKELQEWQKDVLEIWTGRSF